VNSFLVNFSEQNLIKNYSQITELTSQSLAPQLELIDKPT